MDILCWMFWIKRSNNALHWTLIHYSQEKEGTVKTKSQNLQCFYNGQNFKQTSFYVYNFKKKGSEILQEQWFLIIIVWQKACKILF